MVVGIVNAAAVTAVNGSGATFGMPVGATKVIGVYCVSAPRAGATRNTDKSDTTTPFATSANRGEAIVVFMMDLTIGYADTNGGVSNRLIDPLSISLGTLVARDHATGAITHFRIPRITGVSPAN